MTMKNEYTLLIAFMTLLAMGCEPVESMDVSEDSVCLMATDHVRDCLGVEVAPQEYCDVDSAESILSQTCEDMNRMASNPKADGGWFAWMHCQLGVLHFCELPVCEEISNPLTPIDCAFALGSEGCAQCDYYQCMENQMQCGPNGYLEGFVGKYCQRFSSITYPRMTPQGKVWMEEVRECLIVRLHDGRVPGETCGDVKQRGLADHKTCYLEAGLCQLPLSDWLGIVATLSPLEFPFIQALGVGIPCVRDWLGWQ